MNFKVGKRIRARRRELGMTLEELADRTSRHPTYIGQLERGEKEPSRESRMILGQVLGLSLCDLCPTGPGDPLPPVSDSQQVVSILRGSSRAQRKIIVSTLRHLSKILKLRP